MLNSEGIDPIFSALPILNRFSIHHLIHSQDYSLGLSQADHSDLGVGSGLGGSLPSSHHTFVPVDGKDQHLLVSDNHIKTQE